MPQALSTSTARLGSGARATLELAAAALAGEGHVEASERAGGARKRPVELRLRRLPAIVAVVLLAAVVLAGIGVVYVLAILAHLLTAAVSTLSSRTHVVALH